MWRTQAHWIQQYQAQQALWIHDGNLKRPHAVLTSGKHSNGFFNSRLIIPFDDLMEAAASDLLDLFIAAEGNISVPDRAVGPQTGATKLSQFLSIAIEQRRGRPCSWASPAKVDEDDNIRMVFDDPQHMVLPGERVLLCEDVLTTGGSVERTASAVYAAQGNTLPFILVLVNRSGLNKVNGKNIVALIDHPMPTWEPEECPLCQQGSEAIPPKGENWSRLTAAY